MNERILVVDDDPAMQKVLPLTLEKAGFVPEVAREGFAALEAIEKLGTTLGCILLDVRMPGLDGIEVLTRLKRQITTIPVVMLTALDDIDTAVETMRLGAYDYIVKPVRKDALVETVKKAVQYRHVLIENQKLALENEEYQRSLEIKVDERTRELTEAYGKLKKTNIQTVKVLAETIEAKDPYTRGHCTRVRSLSLETARALGLGKVQVETLEYAALLHDIGKIGISEALLFKKGPLTEEERATFRLHPVIGENILKEVEFFREILPVVRHHHEWYNGKGYPDGSRGKDVEILSRIVSIADAFDAMTSNRPYRKALKLETALKELNRGAGTQFDPDIVEIFMKEQIFSLISIVSV
jgi:putative two-component system response regulator